MRPSPATEANCVAERGDQHTSVTTSFRSAEWKLCIGVDVDWVHSLTVQSAEQETKTEGT